MTMPRARAPYILVVLLVLPVGSNADDCLSLEPFKPLVDTFFDTDLPNRVSALRSECTRLNCWAGSAYRDQVSPEFVNKLEELVTFFTARRIEIADKSGACWDEDDGIDIERYYHEQLKKKTHPMLKLIDEVLPGNWCMPCFGGARLSEVLGDRPLQRESRRMEHAF